MNELPDDFMEHLQFVPGPVPDADVPPPLPPHYPVVFVPTGAEEQLP